jgi:signal transduction histidine kinase
LYVTYEGNEIVFCVQDYGIGIPPEMLPNLFQPFYRGYNVGQIPGTGLGLALVKQCVDLHQGQIKVASELNYGSTFTMWVPVIQHSSHIATNMIDVN